MIRLIGLRESNQSIAVNICKFTVTALKIASTPANRQSYEIALIIYRSHFGGRCESVFFISITGG